MYLLDKHSQLIRTQNILFLVIFLRSVCCFTGLTRKPTPWEGMLCIYANFTEEPLLTSVFTSLIDKAHPDLNSVTWILLGKKEGSLIMLTQLHHIFGLYQLFSCMKHFL